MSSFAILPAPATNRVYGQTAGQMMKAELEVLGQTAMRGRIQSLEWDRIKGTDYLHVECEILGEQELRLLAMLSGFYVLFSYDGDYLLPWEVPSSEIYPSDLLSILKYQGKTNEQFTRLLLNVTAFTACRPGSLLVDPLRVLDPVCGRGTTLNQAAMYGWDVVGVDVDAKDFELYGAFLTTWLKDHRLKHTAATTPVRRNKAVLAKKYEAVFARDKRAYLAGQKQSVTFYNADTVRTGELIRPGTVDAVVADLPYGVQHGSRGPRGLVRNPVELLEAALPGWADALRSGGAIGLAWNTRVAPRADLVDLLTEHGLTVQVGPGYDDLEHRVDRAITRDVVIARKDTI